MSSSIACVTPDCKKARRCRGMCINCYNKAYEDVRAGKTTWAELEKQGKALPARTAKERSRLFWRWRSA